MTWSNHTKHVSSPLRTACLTRDGNQCTALMLDGTRCTATTNLEADHIDGWTPGEHLTVDMLQTLCSWHHNKKTQGEAARARNLNKPVQKRRQVRHPGLVTGG